MFEWLSRQMATVKTPKFYRVDGPVSGELRQAIEASAFPLPPSYKQFVLQFGNAELYRKVNNYYVVILAGPRQLTTSTGENLVQFGRTWNSLASFDTRFLDGSESPVFECYKQSMRKTADGFEEWLEKKCAAARKRFTRKEWEAVENGPRPFNQSEEAIVDARRQFRWRVLDVAPSGEIRFEIHNGSDLILPYLSVGIRAKLREREGELLNGGAYLPISSIAPGETRIISHDCYKQFVLPEATEVFALADPGPEDREQYWEFKVGSSSQL